MPAWTKPCHLGGKPGSMSSTIPTSGSPPSSTAPSTSASSSSTTARTTWSRRNRGANAHYQRVRVPHTPGLRVRILTFLSSLSTFCCLKAYNALRNALNPAYHEGGNGHGTLSVARCLGLRHGLHAAGARQLSCSRFIFGPGKFCQPRSLRSHGRHGKLPPLRWQFFCALRRQATRFQRRCLVLSSGDNSYPEVGRSQAENHPCAGFCPVF